MYNKTLVFWAACIGMLLFGIVMLSLGTINTFLISKYSLDELTVGSLAALLPFGILAGSLIFGPLVDRYGYKIMLIVSTVFILLCIESFAFSSSFFIIQLSFFMIGLAGGAINGATNALVADISSEGKSAKLSLLGVFYGIGALGMPSVTAFLTMYFSYKNIITGIGIAMLAPLVFFTLLRFPEPKQKQRFPIKESLALFKEPTLVMIGMVLFFESALEGVANNWTTSYLQKEMALSTPDALYALSLLVLALTITRLVLGGMLLKVSSKLVLHLSMALILLGLIVLKFAATFAAGSLGLVILGIGFAGVFPILLGYVGELYAHLSGTAFSIVLVLALLGNTLVNYLVGLVSHQFGIRHYLTILTGCVVLMYLILLSVRGRLTENSNKNGN